MDTRDIYKLVRELSEEKDDVINLYDSMDIELSEGFVIETGVVGFTKDGVIVHLDEDAMEMLDLNGILIESEEAEEEQEKSEKSKKFSSSPGTKCNSDLTILRSPVPEDITLIFL